MVCVKANSQLYAMALKSFKSRSKGNYVLSLLQKLSWIRRDFKFKGVVCMASKASSNTVSSVTVTRYSS